MMVSLDLRDWSFSLTNTNEKYDGIPCAENVLLLWIPRTNKDLE